MKKIMWAVWGLAVAFLIWVCVGCETTKSLKTEKVLIPEDKKEEKMKGWGD